MRTRSGAWAPSSGAWLPWRSWRATSYAGDGIGVTELGGELGVDKSTAFRILATLVGCGYAVRDGDSRRYRLGSKVVELSRRLLSRCELRREARPFLHELAEGTGETVTLAALVGDTVVRIDREEARGNFQVVVASAIGSELPAHCTVGKAILAGLPETEVRRILTAKGMKRYTMRTMVSVEALTAHLQTVRDQGYALDDEEYEEGLRCIGAPVHDHTGRVVGAMNISGPSTRLTSPRVAGLGVLVREVCARLSTHLGWPGKRSRGAAAARGNREN